MFRRVLPVTLVVAPTPELLIGFPTFKEAQEMQHFVPTAPLNEIEDRLERLQGRVKSGEIVLLKPAHPQKMELGMSIRWSVPPNRET